MKNSSRWINPLALAVLALGAAASQADSTAANGAQASAWQHHAATFTYMGFTSAYTCDGLEGKVASILRFFGARNAKVEAQGCPRGPDSLTHDVWVKVDFDTLQAAGGDTPQGDIVQARWTPFKLNSQRPFFMGEGDCELIYSMKPLLVANFSFQNLSYDTACTPHELTFNDFRVNGEVLKLTQGHDG
jgi:hypothetical protein